MARPPADQPLAGPALHEAKRDLRARTIAARDALDPAARAAGSAAIVAGIAALPGFTRSRCALLTLPFRSEWDARPLLDRVLARGDIAVLPRVDAAARIVVLHRVEDIDADVTPGYRGIPEPLPTLPQVALAAIDWILVPGVSFDATGRRLGYGGGYYDRLLAQAAARVPRVAGAFDLQVHPAVPTAAHDLTVDIVVTPTRTLLAPAR